MSRRDVPGIVYTIHLAKPVGPADRGPRNTARHYTGWTSNLESRIAEHRAGVGSKLLAAANRLGIAWTVAKTEPGTRARERQLKNHGAARRCPECTKENAMAKKSPAEKILDMAVESLEESARAGDILGRNNLYAAEVSQPQPETGIDESIARTEYYAALDEAELG
jgi:predicted GIY-YIG superfamily endonuclease